MRDNTDARRLEFSFTLERNIKEVYLLLKR